MLVVFLVLSCFHLRKGSGPFCKFSVDKYLSCFQTKKQKGSRLLKPICKLCAVGRKIKIFYSMFVSRFTKDFSHSPLSPSIASLHFYKIIFLFHLCTVCVCRYRLAYLCTVPVTLYTSNTF
jgi:hypothetical protein